MTVLNGAQGLGEVFSQVVGMGITAIPMLRGALEQTDATGNGTKPAKAQKDEKAPP
jgi:hypothetical protein